MSAPREFIELPQGMRARIEATIEALVAVLDQLDGDADFEPSLGWGGHGYGAPQSVQGGYDGDRERATGPRDEEGEECE